MNCILPGSSVCGDAPGNNTGVGCHSCLQGIFPALGWNPGLPHCKQILYHLSYQGSPKLLEWIAYTFSRGIFLTQESNQSPALQVDSLPVVLPGESILFSITTSCFSIHLSNLGCFLILAITNGTSVNIGMHVLFQTCFVWVYGIAVSRTADIRQ